MKRETFNSPYLSTAASETAAAPLQLDPSYFHTQQGGLYSETPGKGQEGNTAPTMRRQLGEPQQD